MPVGINTEATFSEAMDASTITNVSGASTTFTLTKQGASTPVAATVGYDATTKKATLDPSANLEAGATYTATVKGGASGVKDLAGNPLTSDKTWSFSTAASAPNNLAAPSNLMAVRGGNVKAQRIDLSWTDNSTGEAKFVIERSTTSTFTSNLVTYEVRCERDKLPRHFKRAAEDDLLLSSVRGEFGRGKVRPVERGVGDY